MSAKRIVLHIGLHKTGTSSIQETLRVNRERLIERGLLFPRTLPGNHSNLFYNAFGAAPETYHANRARGLGREEIATRTARTLAALAEEVAASPCETIVFSGEDACTFDKAAAERAHEFFAGLVPGAAIEILFYTRHPIDYIASAVQENVKGNGLTVARAKQIHTGTAPRRYQRVHDVFAGVFGKEALRFRSFEAARERPGGLIADFMAALGLTAEGLREVRRNESIAGELVGFLSERNGATPPLPLPKEDAAKLFALKGSPADVLDAAEKARLWQFAAGDLVFLSRTYGIRYEREPARPRADDRRAAFLEGVAEILPQLTPEVAEALSHYLAQSGLQPAVAAASPSRSPL